MLFLLNIPLLIFAFCIGTWMAATVEPSRRLKTICVSTGIIWILGTFGYLIGALSW
jgi:hypothetical protein